MGNLRSAFMPLQSMWTNVLIMILRFYILHKKFAWVNWLGDDGDSIALAIIWYNKSRMR